MAQIFCINCGNKIPEGAHFCPACGTPRPALPSDYQEQPAVQQPVQQPAQQPQPYAPQQDQYAAPDMPPPLGPEQPYQQPYQQPYAPGMPPQQYPPKKKVKRRHHSTHCSASSRSLGWRWMGTLQVCAQAFGACREQ